MVTLFKGITKRLWKKAILNAAEARRNSQMGAGDSETDTDGGCINFNNDGSNGSPSKGTECSGTDTLSASETTDLDQQSVKTNTYGEVKTQRYTKRVKPPLPKGHKKSKGTQKPTCISSRLAEKRMQEQVMKLYCLP